MDIGKERETIIVEPIEDPFKRQAPEPERDPAPVETPENEPEKVPA